MSKVFLIGAGATKAQYPSAPLANDFFERLYELDHDLFSSISESVTPLIFGKDLVHENIEDIMELSYQFPSSNRNSFLEDIYTAIFKLLASSTGSTTNFIEDYINGRRIIPQTLMKNLLNDPRLDENSFFLNLNYDLYLDREVMSINGGIINYGLENGTMAGVNGINVSDHKRFSVYHLHGALNWRYLSEKEKVIIDLGAITPTYGRNGSNLCLIAPGIKNPNDHPILKKIWKVANMRLFEAEELIIVGCSLNPKDIDLTNLVKCFVTKNGVGKVKVITKGRTSYKNYQEILGDGFKFYDHGFCKNGEKGALGAIEFIFS